MLALGDDAPVTAQQIKERLAYFRRQGFPVNENDCLHQQAYANARLANRRPTGEFLMTWIEKQTADVSTGVSTSYECFAVPSVNFPVPPGLPEHLEDKKRKLEDLSDYTMPHGSTSIDFNNHIILDGSADKRELGNNVKNINFFLKSQNTCDVTGGLGRNLTGSPGRKRVGQPQAALTNSPAQKSAITSNHPQNGSQPQAASANSGASPQGQKRARELLDDAAPREALRRRGTPISDGDDPKPLVNRTDQLKATLKVNLVDLKKAVEERKFITESE